METLRIVINNWKTQMMQFQMEGRTVTLFGDASLVRSKISLKAMIRTLRKEKEGYYVELNVVEKSTTEEGYKGDSLGAVPEFLSHVIEQNAVVFDAPRGLPPNRGHEHAIFLKEGSNPVGIRPYRYPQ